MRIAILVAALMTAACAADRGAGPAVAASLRITEAAPSDVPALAELPAAPAAMPPPPPDRPEYLRDPDPVLQPTGDERLDAYRRRILMGGGPAWRPYLLRAFAGVRANPAILAADAAIPQPGDAAEWVRILVTEARASEGRKRYFQVRRVPDVGYGSVPPEIVLAIWGAESDYGARPPTFDMVEALAMLGAYGRGRHREAFDIYAAAAMLAERKVRRPDARAYANGTIGQVGWYPADYQQRTKDRRLDIWNSQADIAAAIAATLPSWHADRPAVIEIDPPRLDPANPRHARQLRNAYYDPRDMRRADGKPWGELAQHFAGRIYAPAGPEGPHFMTSINFRLLWQANETVARRPEAERDGYALAIALLAQRIAGGPPLKRPF